MKQIGAEIGVNESRVSQLHARAIQRLKKALGADCSEEMAAPIIPFQDAMRRLRMAKADMPSTRSGVVLEYKTPERASRKASGEDFRRRAKKVSEAKRLREPATA